MGNGSMNTEFVELPRGAKDKSGQRFGRLTVLGPVKRKPTYKKGVAWFCQCDCGNTTTVMAGNLQSGHSRSCGCLSVDTATRESTTHGMTDTRLYQIWGSMIQRCEDSRCKAYANYGGRGILVCEEWRHDFKAFYDHVVMLPNYNNVGYSLDRINNDEGYKPGNIKWSTRIEQGRNKRGLRPITFNGVTMLMSEWDEHAGMPEYMLGRRLRAGWSIERALTTPARITSRRRNE